MNRYTLPIEIVIIKEEDFEDTLIGYVVPFSQIACRGSSEEEVVNKALKVLYDVFKTSFEDSFLYKSFKKFKEDIGKEVHYKIVRPEFIYNDHDNMLPKAPLRENYKKDSLYITALEDYLDLVKEYYYKRVRLFNEIKGHKQEWREI